MGAHPALVGCLSREVAEFPAAGSSVSLFPIGLAEFPVLNIVRHSIVYVFPVNFCRSSCNFFHLDGLVDSPERTDSNYDGVTGSI